MTRAADADGGVAYSARALISWRIREEAVWHRGVLRGFAETMGPAAAGSITVDRDTVSVDDGGSGSGSWRHLDLGAVQAASSSLQLSLPADRFVQFRFPDDSPRRWETLMRRLVADAWGRAGRGRVVEFQPRIVAAAAAVSPRPVGQPPAGRNPVVRGDGRGARGGEGGRG